MVPAALLRDRDAVGVASSSLKALLSEQCRSCAERCCPCSSTSSRPRRTGARRTRPTAHADDGARHRPAAHDVRGHEHLSWPNQVWYCSTSSSSYSSRPTSTVGPQNRVVRRHPARLHLDAKRGMALSASGAPPQRRALGRHLVVVRASSRLDAVCIDYLVAPLVDDDDPADRDADVERGASPRRARPRQAAATRAARRRRTAPCSSRRFGGTRRAAG